MSVELEDDMSFADWSAHLDSLSADSNHCWLPAYGLQPPVDQGPTPQQFLFLETIQEETSDDLRSESSRSSHAGWPESDSDAGSVIHIAATYHGEQDAGPASGPLSWSGSERDLAVPPKRRRQDDWAPGGGAGGTGVALSRSSSLIAFESLERRLSEEEEALGAGGLGAFRTTATLRPFDWADSRTPSTSASSDSSDDESEDSDDSLMQSFNSSRGSFRSSAGSERLRAFRSLDSLSALGALGGGGSGGSANSGAAHLSRPCQDLSLSSAADDDGAPNADGDAFSSGSAGRGRQERSHSLSPKASLRSLLDATYSLSDHEDAAEHDNGYQVGDHDHGRLDTTYQLGDHGRLDTTYSLSDHGDLDTTYAVDHSAAMTRGDFLDEPDLDDLAVNHKSSSSSSTSSSTSESSTEQEDVLAMPVSTESEATSGSARTVRSAENLSEDSGFGEHASYLATPSGKRLTVCPILEDDVADNDASSCYSACSSNSSSSGGGGGGGRKQKDAGVHWGAGDAKFSAGWHRSAPDLLVCSALTAVAEELADGTHPGWSTGAYGPTMASTPDLNKSALGKAAGPGSALGASQGKGVHFCDVVAEVSWRDSYSDVDDEEDEDVDEADGREDDDDDDEEEVEEEEVQAVAYKLQVGSVAVDKPAVARPAAAAATPHSPPSSPPRAPPRAPPRSPAPAPPTAVSQPAAAPAPAPAPAPVTSMAAPMTQPQPQPPSPLASPTASPKKTSRFGDFFQRFSLRRLSGRHHDHASKKLSRSASAPSSPPPSLSKGTNTHLQQSQQHVEDVRIIPLHPTAEELEAERRDEERRRAALATKPPLPPSAPPRGPRGVARPQLQPAPGHAHHPRGQEPRDVTAAAAAAAVTAAVAWRSSSSMAGLLETDLDADLPAPGLAPPHGPAGKARSLLDVSGYASAAPQGPRGPHGPRAPSPGGMLDAQQDPASRAKSMEFLLDRRNQEAVQPPENALQGLQNRVLSEHELRVQRSLQQLNVPDWYKNSARPAEGFLLKRGSDAGASGAAAGGRRTAGGWPGLGVKTTSLSSLRSPTTAVRLGSSPSPPPAAFTRWSSSRLAGSCSATPSTSPSGSARSSFNHRQPYLGWRSQERLSGTPRTPAERLAQGLLEQREQQRLQQRLRPAPGTGQGATTTTDHSQVQTSSPNLSDVRSSIKEVTSAIVHYVSAANGPGSSSDVRVGAPAASNSDLRGGHPTASTGASPPQPRVCWIESSFVGSRPIEQPQTPDESVVSNSPLPLSHQDLYLDLKQRQSPLGHNHNHNGPHQNHAFPDEIDTHHDSDSSEHTLKRTPSKRDTAFTRKRNRRNLKKNKKGSKGSKTWRTKSKLKVVSLEVLFGIGVCML